MIPTMCVTRKAQGSTNSVGNHLAPLLGLQQLLSPFTGFAPLNNNYMVRVKWDFEVIMYWKSLRAV